MERELRVSIDEINAAVAGLDVYRGLLLAASRLRLLDVGEVGADRPREIAGDGVPGAIDDDERRRHLGDAHSQCHADVQRANGNAVRVDFLVITGLPGTAAARLR